MSLVLTSTIHETFIDTTNKEPTNHPTQPLIGNNGSEQDLRETPSRVYGEDSRLRGDS